MSNPHLPSIASRLPPDVILEIVRHSQDDVLLELLGLDIREKQSMSMNLFAMGAPWVFSQINHLWRDVVLSVSSLWARIDIDHTFTNRMVNPTALLELIMERSKEMALCIRYKTISHTKTYYAPGAWLGHGILGSVVLFTVKGSHVSATDIALAKILIGHCRRWRVVDISSDLTLATILNGIKGKLDALEELGLDLQSLGGPRYPLDQLDAFSDVPPLRHFARSDPMHMRSGSVKLPLSELTQYEAEMAFPAAHHDSLRALTSVVGCVLTARTHNPPGTPISEIIDMPHLTTLGVNRMEILDMISASALRNLDVELCGGSNSSDWIPLARFMIRSSCTLESLRLHLHCGNASGVSAFLAQVPSLKEVRIDGITDIVELYTLLNVRARYGEAFLPSLQTLIIGKDAFVRRYDMKLLLKSFGIRWNPPTTNFDSLRLKITFSPLGKEATLVPPTVECRGLSLGKKWPHVGIISRSDDDRELQRRLVMRYRVDM